VHEASPSAFVDTNVLARHLTGDPRAMAARATAFLPTESDLFLSDLVGAETVHHLDSSYDAPRQQVACSVRSLMALRSIVCVDPPFLRGALEVCERVASTSPRRTWSHARRARESTKSRRSTGRSIGWVAWNASNPDGADRPFATGRDAGRGRGRQDRPLCRPSRTGSLTRSRLGVWRRSRTDRPSDSPVTGRNGPGRGRGCCRDPAGSRMAFR